MSFVFVIFWNFFQKIWSGLFVLDRAWQLVLTYWRIDVLSNYHIVVFSYQCAFPFHEVWLACCKPASRVNSLRLFVLKLLKVSNDCCDFIRISRSASHLLFLIWLSIIQSWDKYNTSSSIPVQSLRVLVSGSMEEEEEEIMESAPYGIEVSLIFRWLLLLRVSSSQWTESLILYIHDIIYNALYRLLLTRYSVLKQKISFVTWLNDK